MINSVQLLSFLILLLFFSLLCCCDMNSNWEFMPFYFFTVYFYMGGIRENVDVEHETQFDINLMKLWFFEWIGSDMRNAALFIFIFFLNHISCEAESHKHLHHDDGDGDSIFMFVVNVISETHTHRRDKSVRPKRLNKHFDIFIHLLHFSNHPDTWLDLCLTCSVHEIYCCLLKIWKLSI